MRNKRLCIGAAKNLLQNGSLNLHVTVVFHVLSDNGDDLRTLAEHVTYLGVHNKVNVALTISDLTIGKAVELFRQGTQRL